MIKRRKKILKYKDLEEIKAGENGEPLVLLNKLCPNIVCRYKKKDMIEYIGNVIMVRQGLALRLGRANSKLNKILPGARLKVVYGYRHPAVQQKYFDRVINKLLKIKKGMSPEKLISTAHNLVASPDVAGHITGGAIDLTIEYNGREVDMGTKIADFSNPEKIKTNSRLITKSQRYNRTLLHDLLTEQGLAPFYGEWWHFSYGDKEWAKFYGKLKSKYSSIDNAERQAKRI